ncbi:hypothetical protein I204_00881 [Kwoniella mangroviensis CBS 8886]|nr:hypothetical protein I204_00881 [Kwoniella mangroviensis CBS 8886]
MAPPIKDTNIGPSPTASNASTGNVPNASDAAPKPKQRKLNRTLPQLKRNAACIPCRRRRIKCDAGKPHCSSCVRSYHFLARTQPDEERDARGIQCFYEEDAEDVDEDRHHAVHMHSKGDNLKGASGSSPMEMPRGTKRKGTSVDEDPRDVIKKLEEKVAELQQALAATSMYSNPPGSSTTITSNAGCGPAYVPPQQRSQPIIETSSWAGPTPNQFPADFLSAPYNPPDVAPTVSDTAAIPPFNAPFVTPLGLPQDGSAPQPTGPPRRSTLPTSSDDIDAEAGRFSGPFLDILFPGWPPKLPTPSMLDHLVETFFNMVPSVPRVLHRQTFLTRLALPPTHADFPHVALLHAICATAARYTAAVKCRPVPEAIEKTNQDAKRANGKGLPYDDPADETCFSERNARYAMNAMKFEHVSGRGLLDMLQAMIVMGHWGQSSAKWIEGWIIIGSGGRLAICLGLLDYQPDNFGMPALRQSILGPPKTDAEREERRAVMYYIMTYDCISAASSGWPNSLPIEELTARMPCHRNDFAKLDDIPENPQSYHSPDLWTYHPVADGFNMMLKGVILLSRACRFIRKCRNMEPADRLIARQVPEFKQIDSDIAAFNLHFPPALRYPVQYLQGHAKGVDADLIAAHLIPRIASIFLHEPFADVSDPSCVSAARILMEARAVLNIVYLVVSSNADISYMVMPICSCNYFFTAARTLLLFYQRALETGDRSAAHSFRNEIAVFKIAFQALSSRFAMGARHLIMIEMVSTHIEEETLGRPLPESEVVPRLPAQPPAWHVAYPDMRRGYDPSGFPAEEEPSEPTTSRPGHPDAMAGIKLDQLRSQQRQGSAMDHIHNMSNNEGMDHRRDYVSSPRGNFSASASASAGSTSQSPNGPIVYVNWQSVASHTTEGHLPPELQDPNMRTQAQIHDPKFSLL